MSLFEQLDCRATSMRAPNSIREPVRVSAFAGKTGEIRPSLDANEEHELILTVRATFWANQAQYPQARRIAERALASLLYRDVEDVLCRIEHAIADGSAHDALHWCGKLHDVIRGEVNGNGDETISNKGNQT